jgi:Flp pilus assembly protein TadG
MFQRSISMQFGILPQAVLRDRRGAAVLEFALVALPFLVLMLGVMEVGYDLFVQVALDAAVENAARNVKTGSVTGYSGETSAQFAAAAVCPGMSGLFSCSLLVVGVQHIASGYNYYSNPSPMTIANAASASGSVCTGTGGELMLIQAWYTGPTFAGLLIPGFATTYNGSKVHLTTASAGFVNEYFSGGQTTGTGC